MLLLQAVLELEDGPTDTVSSVSISTVLGDGTGFLHLQPGDRFYVEFSPYESVRSSPPCNFIIEEGSELWLPQDFRVIGKASPAIDFQGHMTGVFNLTLAEGRQVNIGDEATNSRYVAGEYVDSPQGQ